MRMSAVFGLAALALASLVANSLVPAAAQEVARHHLWVGTAGTSLEKG
jgi:hypothetical protein